MSEGVLKPIISVEEIVFALRRMNSDGIKDFLVTFETRSLVQIYFHVGGKCHLPENMPRKELISDIADKVLYPEVELKVDVQLRIKPVATTERVNKLYFYEIEIGEGEGESIKSIDYSTVLEALQHGRAHVVKLIENQLNDKTN